MYYRFVVDLLLDIWVSTAADRVIHWSANGRVHARMHTYAPVVTFAAVHLFDYVNARPTQSNLILITCMFIHLVISVLHCNASWVLDAMHASCCCRRNPPVVYASIIVDDTIHSIISLIFPRQHRGSVVVDTRLLSKSLVGNGSCLIRYPPGAQPVDRSAGSVN